MTDIQNWTQFEEAIKDRGTAQALGVVSISKISGNHGYLRVDVSYSFSHQVEQHYGAKAVALLESVVTGGWSHEDVPGKGQELIRVYRP